MSGGDAFRDSKGCSRVHDCARGCGSGLAGLACSAMASQRKRQQSQKEVAGRLVLRLYGDTLWRWEHEERRRVEAEREEVRRRAQEAYSAALVRRFRERQHRDHRRWMWWLNRFQEELWEEERWANQFQ